MAIARLIVFAPLMAWPLLAACEYSPPIESEGGVVVSCALAGAGDFNSKCRLVEIAEGQATYFILRHPDGGFRRLDLAETPAGFVEFDGARAAESWREGDDVILQIGEDRYRWLEPAGE